MTPLYVENRVLMVGYVSWSTTPGDPPGHYISCCSTQAAAVCEIYIKLVGFKDIVFYNKCGSPTGVFFGSLFPSNSVLTTDLSILAWDLFVSFFQQNILFRRKTI